MKNLINKVIQNYNQSGLLIRGNDGQTPTTPDDVNTAISNLVLCDAAVKNRKTTNLLTLINNGAPSYSASLLSGINAPLLWYNSDYVEAFPNKNKKPKCMGERTIVAVIFKNDNIVVNGGCAWDADSNLRNLGLIPNNQLSNKTTPTNLFAQLEVFNNIGNFKYKPPTSNNNNPLYNPLFTPRTNNSNQNAKTNEEVKQFLQEIGSYKNTWVNTLKKNSRGYNNRFANYINTNYNTGLEPEILVEPKNSQPYYKKKFDLNEILCVAFITDGKKHNTHTSTEYKNRALSFLQEATATGGWINPTNNHELKSVPVISITRVSLPSVPLSGTTASNVNIGKEWVKYLTCRKYQYNKTLRYEDFKVIT